MRPILQVVVLAALLGAASASALAEAGRGLTPVAGAELRQRLPGAHLLFPEHGATPEFWEEFDPRGTWQLIGPRAPIVGRYRIVGDRFCVTLEATGKEICRQLLRDREGRLFASAWRSPNTMPERVEISKSPEP